MSCHEIRPKLDQFFSGELTEMEPREIEAHLAGCKACRAEVAAQEQWKQLTRGAGNRFSPSPKFRKRLTEQYASDRPARRRFPLWTAVLAACGALAVVTLMAAGYRGALVRRQIFGEIADQHAAILRSGSALDVASGEDQEVESWFQEKVPFTLRIPELKDTPFSLAGGRLTFLDQTPGAQLIFVVNGRQVSAFVFQRNPRLRRVFHDRDLMARHASFNVKICGKKQLRYLIVGDADSQSIHQLADMPEATE